MSGYLTYHPSNAAEAKDLIATLPGGSAQFASPSAPQSQLPVSPPAHQQEQKLTLPPRVAQPQLTLPSVEQPQLTLPPSPPIKKENLETNAHDGAVQPTSETATGTGSSASTSNNTGATAATGIPVPGLQNIVASVNVDCRLDLKTIALHARNAEYNPKRFAAAIMRIREPKSTALIFASGKMIVTGVKCEPDARLAARKYARVLQKLGYNARFCNFSIHNVVASVDVGFPIHISQMQAVHHAFSSYEPGRWHGHPRNRSRTCHANCIQSSSLA